MFLSLVRPERISSPTMRTAAVTMSCTAVCSPTMVRPLRFSAATALRQRHEPPSVALMHFPAPLIRGRLVKRYKRFLADVILDSGEAVFGTGSYTGALVCLSARRA